MLPPAVVDGVRINAISRRCWPCNFLRASTFGTHLNQLGLVEGARGDDEFIRLVLSGNLFAWFRGWVLRSGVWVLGVGVLFFGVWGWRLVFGFGVWGESLEDEDLRIRTFWKWFRVKD